MRLLAANHTTPWALEYRGASGRFGSYDQLFFRFNLHFVLLQKLVATANYVFVDRGFFVHQGPAVIKASTVVYPLSRFRVIVPEKFRRFLQKRWFEGRCKPEFADALNPLR